MYIHSMTVTNCKSGVFLFGGEIKVVCCTVVWLCHVIVSRLVVTSDTNINALKLRKRIFFVLYVLLEISLVVSSAAPLCGIRSPSLILFILFFTGLLAVKHRFHFISRVNRCWYWWLSCHGIVVWSQIRLGHMMQCSIKSQECLLIPPVNVRLTFTITPSSFPLPARCWEGPKSPSCLFTPN